MPPRPVRLRLATRRKQSCNLALCCDVNAIFFVLGNFKITEDKGRRGNFSKCPLIDFFPGDMPPGHLTPTTYTLLRLWAVLSALILKTSTCHPGSKTLRRRRRNFHLACRMPLTFSKMKKRRHPRRTNTRSQRKILKRTLARGSRHPPVLPMLENGGHGGPEISPSASGKLFGSIEHTSPRCGP